MTPRAIQECVKRLKEEIFQFLNRPVRTNSFSNNPEGLRQVGDLIAAWGQDHGFLKDGKFETIMTLFFIHKLEFSLNCKLVELLMNRNLAVLEKNR